MKLLRVGPKGHEKTAVLDQDGQMRDVSDHVAEFAGQAVCAQTFEMLARLDLGTLPVLSKEMRVGSCLASVPNFYCIGLNYGKHADETGMARPQEPILFSKASSAICGPADPIIVPRGSNKTDWEVELGVVIGQEASHVSEADALDYVEGYCAINDLSERSFQMDRGGQWIKGKSAPNFGPIGPYFVTRDEVADPQNLDLWLRVNGTMMQSSNTSDMIFSVREIISHLSQFLKLMPGDIIATGTPEGVGLGMSPPVFLKEGDVVELGIEGLGQQRQEVIKAS